MEHVTAERNKAQESTSNSNSLPLSGRGTIFQNFYILTVLCTSVIINVTETNTLIGRTCHPVSPRIVNEKVGQHEMFCVSRFVEEKPLHLEK